MTLELPTTLKYSTWSWWFCLPCGMNSWPQQRDSLERANRITPKGKLWKLPAITRGGHANRDSFQRTELREGKKIEDLELLKIKCRCLFSSLLDMRAKYDIYKKCLILGPREIFIKVVQNVSPSLTHLSIFLEECFFSYVLPTVSSVDLLTNQWWFEGVWQAFFSPEDSGDANRWKSLWLKYIHEVGGLLVYPGSCGLSIHLVHPICCRELEMMIF